MSSKFDSGSTYQVQSGSKFVIFGFDPTLFYIALRGLGYCKRGVIFFRIRHYTLLDSIENGKLKKRDGRFFLIPCEDKHPLVGDQSVDEFFQTRVLRYP